MSEKNDYFLLNYRYDNKIRLGNNFDGGYVVADLCDYDCYISAGIGDDESFSRDFIERYEMKEQDCFAFDSTIENLPYNFHQKLNHIPKNISIIEDNQNTNLKSLIENYSNVFLKMDIEGYEFEWFKFINLRTLSKIRQMVVEFHNILDRKEEILYILKRINKTHYLIHSHGNNWGPVIDGSPTVIELTFLRKDCMPNNLELNNQKLPSILDFPNNVNCPDIELGFGDLGFIK